MFEYVEQELPINKDEYEQKLPDLRTQLFFTQRKLIEAKIPTLILIDGIPGAGRGDIVNLLNEWMDSRRIRNRTFWHLSDEARERPEYWRYWNVMPGAGEMAVFFGGWYEKPVEKAVEGKLKGLRFENAMSEAIKLEQMLSADGMLIIKLFLYLPKDNFKKTMKKRGGLDPLAEGKGYCKDDYEALTKYYAKAIRMTDTTSAHWYTINSSNVYQRNLAVLEVLINTMHNALNITAGNKEFTASIPIANPLPIHVLDKVDLSKKIDSKAYSDELKHYKNTLRDLTLKAYSKGVSSVFLFEGWDAAGKGGAIRRLTSSIDARIRQTIQIASPTDEEKAHHYLWRFWRHLPRAGYVTIYDRSWYGRVLVERVEEFATISEWSRAYEEINTFESQLVSAGIVLVKFWLHISQDEQMRRFKEREELEWKQYKITEEDWRNREKADVYHDAIDDMLIRTSTDIAPWTVVPGNDKHYARIEVLKTVCEQLKKKL